MTKHDQIDLAHAIESLFQLFFNNEPVSVETPCLQTIIEGDIDFRDPEREWNTLSICACYGRNDLVSHLLFLGADPNNNPDPDYDYEDTCEECEWSALHYASSRGHSDVVGTLLLHNADPNVRDHHERTPIFYAHSKDIVQQLASSGADMNAVDNEGLGPLQFAIMRHPINRTPSSSIKDILRALIDSGSDPYSDNLDHSTISCLMVQFEYEPWIKLFVDIGVNIEPMKRLFRNELGNMLLDSSVVDEESVREVETFIDSLILKKQMLENSNPGSENDHDELGL